ncbi:YjjW family glycine radical enzyme activase [Ferrimonas sp. SCSIO 43195]|uniref:YjjW family glycine radical enzyme activase n=1 Tax=Ferrimonas sp. SCSIO 43195 TaxID=2822844 RepID=UPI00207585A7|nr:YjjW family glycine radical enzyme activase [Ferrimonas sp. SCSIO 43195]USD36629.1 YjjW family glycine radical enzyme activase [Ferrimonas sp. SCSIO 43195]
MEITALAPLAPAPKPKPATALLSKVLDFSCVDGPGSRMVLFFQGCNMDCGSCHNPQTIGLCNHCGDCVSHCPQDALTLVRGSGQRKALRCDPALCQQCDDCLPHCPRGGNPAALRFTHSQMLARISANALLLDGVTFSGGEATLQRRWIQGLCDAMALTPSCRSLTRLLDSNGLLAAEHWPALLQRVDGVMLDIKALDNGLHRRLTGRSNHQVLASARLLAEANKLEELRWLVIAGCNDTDAEVAALIRLHRQLQSPVPIRLNGFQHHGVRPEFAETHPPTPASRLDQLDAQLTQAGIEVRRTGIQ